MDKNPDITNFVASLIIKAVVIAARFSGRVRKRSVKRLVATEVDAKGKEIIFLTDMVEQLQMQDGFLKPWKLHFKSMDLQNTSFQIVQRFYW